MKIRLYPAYKAEEESGKSHFIEHILFGGIGQEAAMIYYFEFPCKFVYARGCDFEGGFLVFKDSLAAKFENSKLCDLHRKLRKLLIDSGVLKDKGSSLIFTRPYLFKNEYEATCVIAGNRKCRTHTGIWFDQRGKTPLENRLIGTIDLEINDG